MKNNSFIKQSESFDNLELLRSFDIKIKKEHNPVDNIISRFNVLSEDSRTEILHNAVKKIWKVARSIKSRQNERQESIRKRWYICDPKKSPFRKIFDTFIIIIILIDLIFSPYRYLVHKNPQIQYEIIFDSIFIFEIIINFFTGYYDQYDNVLITKPLKIASYYFLHGFMLDFLYAFPYWLINRNFVFMRFFKVYRYPYILANIKRFVLFLSSFCIVHLKNKKNIVLFISLFFNLGFTMHYFACFYIYLAHINEELNWTTGQDLDLNDPLEIYISSIYMMVQTFSTAALGDLTPKNKPEMCFIMVGEIINCGLFGYVISNTLEIFTSHVDTLTFKYQLNLNIFDWIINFMDRMPRQAKRVRIPNEKWDEVIKNYNMYYGTKSNFSWISNYPYLKEIRPIDRNELLSKSFEETVKDFEAFFEGLSPNVRNSIILSLRTHIQKTDYIAIKENNEIKRIYLIKKGTVYVSQNKKVFCQLDKGDAFGIMGLLNKTSEYTYEFAPNANYIQLYSITLKDLYKILSYDEACFQILFDKAVERKVSFEYIKELDENVDTSNIDLRTLYLEERHNLSDDRSVMMIPRITEYHNFSQTIEYESRESLNKEINTDGLGNLEHLTKKHKKLKVKLKELHDLETRLNLVNKQIDYLNKNLSTVFNHNKL